MSVRVDFFCNDPDNGIFVGKFHRMQVSCGDLDMEFEGPWFQKEGIVFRLDNGGEHAIIGRLRIPILGYRERVGNWCWNAIWVPWPRALEIINYLGRNKVQDWHMIEGPCKLFDAFNERHVITPLEWRVA